MRSLLLTLLTTLTITGLTACGPAPTSTTEMRTFEVTEVKRPKHFRVSLRDVETGQNFSRLHVSKRCHNWRKTKVGSQWQLPVTTRVYKDGSKRVSVNARSLCQR